MIEVEFDKVKLERELTYEEVMECDSPFDVCEAFLDSGAPAIYLAADDKGNGPFWLKVDRDGSLSAYSPNNLPLEGEIKVINPKITIQF